MNPEQIPLRDLHLPEAVDWWPPAPGWWFLAALLAAAVVRYLWAVVRHWRQGAARRAALAEHARLSRSYAADGNVVALAGELSALLRRAMLAYAPRQTVAGLTGDDWLQWLDRGLPAAPFTAGPGRPLAWLPYRGGGADVDVEALLDTVKKRLQTPLPKERA
jgi:hypothetical protein